VEEGEGSVKTGQRSALVQTENAGTETSCVPFGNFPVPVLDRTYNKED